MSNEPKVTRFGADPTVDQELATKAYVDAGGGGGGNDIIGGFNFAVTQNQVFFMTLFGGNWAAYNEAFDATEANISFPIFYDVELNRFICIVPANSKDGNTIIGMRDDGVTAGSVTIGGGLTGAFDSGALTVAIASGSDVNFIYDSTASTGGTLSTKGFFAQWSIT